MDFQISKSLLETALSKVQGIIDSKATIPILAFVRITSNDEHSISITATNLDNTIFSRVDSNQIEVTAQGSICAPARKLFDIVRSLPEGAVSFKKESNDWITVKGVKGRFKIPSMNADQFPETPDYSAVDWIDIAAKTLKTLCSGVAFAISKNVANYNTNGAQLEITDESVCMVATDGHRLSKVTAPLTALLAEEVKVLLPIESFNELAKLVGDSEGDASIGKDENNVFLKVAGHVLAMRMSAGQFPNYAMMMMPASMPSKVRASIPSLVDSLKRAQLIAGEDSNKAVKFSLAEKSVGISAQQAEAGECDEEIDCEYDGDAMNIGINCQYLLEFLSLFKDGNIDIEIKTAESQMLIHPSTQGDVEYKYILMPVRL